MNQPHGHRATAWVLALLTTLSLLAGLDRLATWQHAAAADGAAAATRLLVVRAPAANG